MSKANMEHILGAAAAASLLALATAFVPGGQFVGQAHAQAATSAPAGPPARIRGTIVSLKDQVMVVKPKGGGANITVKLTPDFKVAGAVKLSQADIKDNSYLGIAARKEKDGILHAQEVLVFPEQMRGVGEGQRGWDLTPDSTMTNAAVSGMAKAKGANKVTLTYKDGSADIIIDPKTPIWTIKPADASLLKPGAYIVAMGPKASDGSVTVGNVTAEMNGFKPAN